MKTAGRAPTKRFQSYATISPRITTSFAMSKAPVFMCATIDYDHGILNAIFYRSANV